MQQGKFWWLISFGMLLLMLLYFAFNPSYERSLQAKFYYTIGNYKAAHRLATEAFELDSYNRMAATIMTQSQAAVKFVEYIDEAKSYMEQISAMAESDSITDADKAKMKIMCEIMIDSFVKISPIFRDGRSEVLDKELVEEAQHYYQQFVDLYEKITATL